MALIEQTDLQTRVGPVVVGAVLTGDTSSWATLTLVPEAHSSLLGLLKDLDLRLQHCRGHQRSAKVRAAKLELYYFCGLYGPWCVFAVSILQTTNWNQFQLNKWMRLFNCFAPSINKNNFNFQILLNMIISSLLLSIEWYPTRPGLPGRSVIRIKTNNTIVVKQNASLCLVNLCLHSQHNTTNTVGCLFVPLRCVDIKLSLQHKTSVWEELKLIQEVSLCLPNTVDITVMKKKSVLVELTANRSVDAHVFHRPVWNKSCHIFDIITNVLLPHFAATSAQKLGEL